MLALISVFHTLINTKQVEFLHKNHTHTHTHTHIYIYIWFEIKPKDPDSEIRSLIFPPNTYLGRKTSKAGCLMEM